MGIKYSTSKDRNFSFRFPSALFFNFSKILESNFDTEAARFRLNVIRVLLSVQIIYWLLRLQNQTFHCRRHISSN